MLIFYASLWRRLSLALCHTKAVVIINRVKDFYGTSSWLLVLLLCILFKTRSILDKAENKKKYVFHTWLCSKIYCRRESLACRLLIQWSSATNFIKKVIHLNGIYIQLVLFFRAFGLVCLLLIQHRNHVWFFISDMLCISFFWFNIQLVTTWMCLCKYSLIREDLFACLK